MKKIFLLTALFISQTNFGQGFGITAVNWPVPVGGTINGGVNLGYWLTSAVAASSYDITSMNWQVLDINGDNKADLVITSEKMPNGDVTVYNPTNNPYWKVYLGTGSSFSSSVTNWTVPVGGTINGGINFGYRVVSAAAATSYDISSQNWEVMDVNGDNKPDLVITSEKMSNGDVTVYNPTNNPYWKVYLNTGTSFSTTATNWSIPVGGTTSGGINFGYRVVSAVAATSYDISSQNWEVMDVNGDNKSDLVITSEKMSNGDVTVYNPTNNPYWKVYLNTGTSISTTASNWSIPVGGTTSGGVNFGYRLTVGAAASSYDIGSQNWVVMDIDGDNKSDLVITSEKMSSGSVTDYNPTSSPYWKVYLGTGSSFSTSVTNWAVPSGGTINGGVNLGYWLTAATAASSYDIGSKNWVVTDMNGDNKPDLVITSEKMSNGSVTDYNPTSSPYWKVYLNSSTVSIAENSNVKDWIAYPNPFHSTITVVSDNTKNFQVEIYNVLGEIVLGSQSINQKIEIDLNKETSGVYFIKIISENGVDTKKIIKE
ncbi:MAG: T9SS type A sorting domain-containing protein [Bacteroidia bacterium]|nr:T9SS type A sorting domain-containing protein [Bacteroidia bacterium]